MAHTTRVRIADEKEFKNMLLKLVRGEQVTFRTETGTIHMILADIGFDNMQECLQNAFVETKIQKSGT